jgi:hypothetical protein
VVRIGGAVCPPDDEGSARDTGIRGGHACSDREDHERYDESGGAVHGGDMIARSASEFKSRSGSPRTGRSDTHRCSRKAQLVLRKVAPCCF